MLHFSTAPPPAALFNRRLHWEVRIDSDNTDANYDLAGAAGYTSVQTFAVENAGQLLSNLKNANWTTVTGYYDVAIGEGTSLGMIQVHGNSSGYIANGDGLFAIDNIIVDIAPIPEPATLGLYVVGMAGAFVLRKSQCP